MPLAKNDIITLEITALTNEGSGVGHYKEDNSDGRGMAVFVPLTAVGDVVSCRVVKALKSYAYGRVEKILTASADRIADDCPVYGKCGGCCFRHISYEAELRAKEGFVRFRAYRRSFAGTAADTGQPVPGGVSQQAADASRKAGRKDGLRFLFGAQPQGHSGGEVRITAGTLFRDNAVRHTAGRRAAYFRL